MDARVFDSALSAAARVAFSVALVSACSQADSGDVKSADALTGGEPPRGGGSTGATPKHEMSDAGASCDAAIDPGVPAFTCTERGIKDLFVTNDAGDPEIDPTKVNSDVVACCEKQLSAVDNRDAGPVSWEVISACCYDVVGVTGGWPYPTRHPRACTPWGPPVPPAMRDDMDALLGAVVS